LKKIVLGVTRVKLSLLTVADLCFVFPQKMNGLKLILAILLSSSILMGDAYPRAGEMVLCRIRSVEHQMVEAAVRDGDNPNALPDLFRRCKLTFTETCREYFNAMILLNRTRSFVFLFSRLVFHGSEERNMALTYLLGMAMRCNNIVIAEMLLAEDFSIMRDGHALFWHMPPLSSRPPLNLPLIKQFMSKHREQAADLAPTNSDMKYARDEHAAFLLIDLAIHCDIVSGQQKFDATQMLLACLIGSWLSDAEMAQVALHLLDLGAVVDQDFIDRFEGAHPKYVQTRQALQAYAAANNKIHEDGAELMDQS
jgi:hypothetical protein